KEFDSVSDETHKIIGLEEAEARKIKKFEAEVKEYRSESKDFAQDVFENLFGAKTLDYALPDIIDPDSERNKHITTPEDEEEITYVPNEDEILLDDDDTLVVDEPIITNTSRMHQQQRPQQRDNRGQNRERNDNRNNRSHRPPHHSQSRGPQTQSSLEQQGAEGAGAPKKQNRPFRQRRPQNRDGRNRPPK